jgi:ABC-type uncharacterized transport system substrate-binding protein
MSILSSGRIAVYVISDWETRSPKGAGGQHWRNLMTKISFLFTLSALLIALSYSASAQQPAKVPRIGYLAIVPLSALAVRTDAFRQGLRDRGYIEGKTIIVELRSSDGNRGRLFALAAEIVRMKADVIVTAGGGVTRVVKKATSTIPIVMAQDSDPVGNGFVASLARPGGNITGLSNLSSDLVGKRLELLKEVVPSLSRLAVFGSSNNVDNKRELREIDNTAAAFGVKVQHVDILAPKTSSRHSEPQPKRGLRRSIG